MTPKKRGLGKGLDALLSTSTAARQKQVMSDQRTEQAMAPTNQGELRKLPVEWLQSGKYQPRKDMSQDALEDLANSIRAQGVIQPIVVRPLGEHSFEIIAGERRWRASQLARLEVVPCLVKDVPDEAAVAIALIENIQREDLNAIEEAVALQRLLTEFELTHQQVAEAVGKSRTTVDQPAAPQSAQRRREALRRARRPRHGSCPRPAGPERPGPVRTGETGGPEGADSARYREAGAKSAGTGKSQGRARP